MYPVTGFVMGIDGGVPGAFQLGFIAQLLQTTHTFYRVHPPRQRDIRLTDYAELAGFHNGLSNDF